MDVVVGAVMSGGQSSAVSSARMRKILSEMSVVSSVVAKMSRTASMPVWLLARSGTESGSSQERFSKHPWSEN